MKHIDVMLSSTSEDLKEHREQAIEAVLRVGMYPRVMTSLVAGVNDPYEVSMEMVDKAEVYVGIFAHRYGYIPDDPRNPERLSMTELEYRRAVKRGIPRLIFLIDKDHPVKREYIEPEGEGKQKLADLKKELGTEYTASFFTTPMHLRAELVQALREPKLMEHAKQIAGTYEAEDEENEEVIPRPPDLYSFPPYIQTGKFIGRSRELAQLDKWAQSDDPMMIVSAIGGQGKSALTWHWVKQFEDKSTYDGMLWWSFYERGANMSAFMRHAITYIERGDPDDPQYQNMLHNERKTRLLSLLQGGRYLMVLDGLERILTAYHRLDKAQLRDEEVSDEADMRACIDPKDSDILYQLAGISRSKFLISTRLVPRTLEKHGDLIQSVRLIELTGLSPDDAEALLITEDVNFKNTNQLHGFLHQFGYHGLLLKMVIGRIKQDRRARRDFDRWYRRRGRQFDFTQMDIKQRRTSILYYAMEGLDVRARTLLSRIAAFSDGVQFDTLEAVANPEGDLDGFDLALTELEDRGLLQWDRETDTYDLHPVVRGIAFADLTGDEKQSTYNRIHDHFESQEYSFDNVQDIEQLQIPIMIYQALIGAGRFEDAARFYRGAFARSLLYHLIAYPTMIQLLTSLFPDGIDHPPRIYDKSDQSYVMNAMAAAYSQSGDSLSALSLLGQKMSINFEQRSTNPLMSGLRNYGDVAGEANQLYEQFQAYKLHMAFAQVTGDDLSDAYFALFELHTRQGNWQQTNHMQTKLAELDYKNSLYYYFQAEMQLKKGQDPTQNLEDTIQRGSKISFYRAVMEAYGLYIIYYLQEDDLMEAIHYAEEAIKLARRSGAFYLAQYLGRLARVKAKQGAFDEAVKLIDEAWRGTVVEFDKAELYNCAAEVYRAMGDESQATENAINAYKIAWADGPPYINWYELENAKSHLDALGIAYPDMPPFDESKMEPLPYEDELQAYLEELKRDKADE